MRCSYGFGSLVGGDALAHGAYTLHHARVYVEPLSRVSRVSRVSRLSLDTYEHGVRKRCVEGVESGVEASVEVCRGVSGCVEAGLRDDT